MLNGEDFASETIHWLNSYSTVEKVNGREDGQEVGREEGEGKRRKG